MSESVRLYASRRVLPFVIPAVVAAACLRSPSGAQTSSPAICTLDTSSTNYTMERVEDRLDPADTTSFGAGFRAATGLTGVTFSSITVVADSARCAAGIQAYARISYPTDSIKRNGFLDGIHNIFIVQLSADRFVLNADISSRNALVQHFLVDSTFSVVNVNF